MERQLMEIRVTAFQQAMELTAEKPANFITTAETVLSDAEKIEKYILGYETKPEGE